MRVRCSQVLRWKYQGYGFHVTLKEVIRSLSLLLFVYTQGLQVQDYFGNFHKGTPTDLDLPAVCYIYLYWLFTCCSIFCYLSSHSIVSDRLWQNYHGYFQAWWETSRWLWVLLPGILGENEFLYVTFIFWSIKVLTCKGVRRLKVATEDVKCRVMNRL